MRSEEQAELDSKIENADQYRVDGKVDRAKLTNEADIKAFDEVYDKYDKLITPLLEKETPTEQVEQTTTTDEAGGEGVEGVNVSAVADGQAQQPTDENMGGDNAGDLGGQGLQARGGTAQGGVEAARESRPINEQRRVLSEVDEEIGRIIYGDLGDEGGSVPSDTKGQGVVSASGTDGGVLPVDQGADTNIDAAGGSNVEPSGVDIQGEGLPDVEELKTKSKTVRAKLESAVNDLLSKVKSFNRLPLKAMGARQNLRKEIDKLSKTYGLNVVEENLKLGITDKKGKRIASRGSRVNAANDNKIFEKARRVDDNTDASTLALISVYEGIKLSPQVAADLLGTGQDSFEYRTLQELGMIDEKAGQGGGMGAIEEMADRVRKEGNNVTDSEYADALAEAIGIASMATGKTIAQKKAFYKQMIKRTVIANAKKRKENLERDAESVMVDSEIGSIISKAKEDFDTFLEGLNQTERAEAINDKENILWDSVQRDLRKSEALEGKDIDGYARASFDKVMAEDMAVSNEQVYEYGDEYDFSEGGEDAPFQETTDLGAIAINTFNDVYDRLGVVEATKAANEVIGNDADARKDFVDYVKATRETLLSGKPFEKKKVVVSSPKTFREALKEIVPQISDADADSLVIIGEAMVAYAKKLDPSLTSEYLWGKVQGVMSNDINDLVNKYEQGSQQDGVAEIAKELDRIGGVKKTQIEKIKQIINKFVNYGNKDTNTGRSDSNDSKGQAKRGRQGNVSQEASPSSMANGIAITRQEFDRSYKNYDPRQISRSGKIVGFHSGTINVDSFDGYTPDDLTQQFGYILGESPTDASTFALRKSAGNKPRFVYETEITNGDFLSHDKKPTKEQLKKIGIVNGVDFTNWKGEGSVFDAVAKTFGDWDSVDWNDARFYDLYNKGKQAAAKVLQEKGFIGNKYEPDYALNPQYEVYDSKDIKIKNKYQLYNTDAELLADQYQKAKSNGSNPELVNSVDQLLEQQPKDASVLDGKAVTRKVYHGSSRDFTEFFTNVSWFSDDKNVSLQFATRGGRRSVYKKGKEVKFEPKIYEADITLNNPIRLAHAQVSSSFRDVLKENDISDVVAQKIIDRAFDLSNAQKEMVKNGFYPNETGNVWSAYEKDFKQSGYKYHRSAEIFDLENIVKALMEFGFDGVVTKEGGANSYGVFKNGVIKIKKIESPKETIFLEQNQGQAKGATSLEEGITAYAATADVSTLIHEPSHNLLGLIDELAKDGNEKAIEAQNTIEKHVEKEGEAFFDRSKKAGEKWAQGEYNPNDPTMRQELFARSAEKYFMEGTKAGFSAKMNAIFESFAKMLKDIYKKALNSPELINLSPEMRSLMDAIYGKEKVEKDRSKSNLKKGLYNTIQRFIDDSNYSDEVKEALKNRPESLAPIDNEKDRLALVDTIIEEYGLETVLAESMRVSSEIPQELQGFVFMRALEKLDRDRKKLKGKELEALEEEYLDIHFALGEKMLRAGQFTASMARIYYSRPDVIVKNAEKKINAGNKQANEEADAVIDEVEKILNTEEDQEVIAEDTFDILDALKQQKQIEARITKLSSTKRAIGKATKQVEKVAVATGAGIAMNMTKAARSVRKAELKKMLLGDQLNSGLPVNKIPVFAEYIALTIADGVTDLVTIIKDFRKDGIVDQDHLIAEAYKDVRNQLIADGVPVELISDEGIDATLELLRKEDKRLAEEIKAQEAASFRDKFVQNMGNPKKIDKLKEWAREVEIRTGNTDLVDLANQIEQNYNSKKSAKEKADKDKELRKLAEKARRDSERAISEMIRKGLIAAGFEMKDSLGNPTGKVNWKAVVKDSKNTDETVSKIMTALEGQVSPSELDAIRAALTTAITQAVNERKASQIEAMVRARQRNADRKARGLFSRQRNIDRLSDAINVAGGDMNKITDIIADMFGVQKFTPEQSNRLKDLMEKRNAAAEKGQGNLVAKYEQEIQAIIHYKEFPYLSGDKIGSDLMNAMLASPTTSAQNTMTVFDGAFYTPIYDSLFAQFSGLKAKGLGDKQIFKVIAKAYTKAFWNALDQGWNGNIDIISAQYEQTGNKQSTPSIDFTERTRYKYGQKTALSAADNFKQKFVRFYKRLNNAFDAFGMAVNAETKMYLVLKAQFIGEGMSASEASKAAFDTLYSKDMDELRDEILADNPKMGKIEVERTAYSMLESKLAQTVVRQGQLEAAINTGKIPEVGVLSGIGYFIDKMLKGSTTALNSWSDKAQNPATKTVVQMIKVVNKLLGSISTAFLYPTLRFAELSLKYLPISPIALGYQAGRFATLALYSSMSDQAKADRVFNTHRLLKDFGRSVIGYVVVQALISSLDDDEEDELVGFGPRDIPTKMNEMEVRKLESLNGVSLKFYGPFAMGLYLEAAGLDAKRYGQKPITVTELALMMTTSQYSERMNGIIRNLTSEGDKWKKVVGNILSNNMLIVSPWARTMNDIAGTMTPKVKNITFGDYFKKGLGLNILNDNYATDFMGNTMDLGQMAAYSLDGVKKKFEEFEGKDQDVKDWISENGATGFQRTYKSDEVGGNFLEIGSEQVYELEKTADVLRGTALRSLYADREIFESVKPAIYENLTPSKKDAVDKAALVRFEVDKNKSVEQHREDVLVDWAKQISIDSEVSEINTAAKYVARYDWIMMNGKMEEADKSWVDNEKYNKYIKLLSM